MIADNIGDILSEQLLITTSEENNYSHLDFQGMSLPIYSLDWHVLDLLYCCGSSLPLN